MQRQRTGDFLWTQLERPLSREALDALLATYGAESLLPPLLELLRREKSGSTRAGLGCLSYVALGVLCGVFMQFFWGFIFLFLLVLVLCPVVLFLVLKLAHKQTVRRANLLRLLQLTAHDVRDSSKVSELIRAVRMVSSFENPLLRRELRQELGRLLLRLPTEQARRLTRSERAALHGWLWEAMKWDQPGDTEFCLAALLVLGDAHDRWTLPHAWLCARWHHAPQVREAARACLDALIPARA